MTVTIELATQTPAEVDTALAEIYDRYYVAQSRVSVIETDVEYSQKRIDRVTRQGGTPSVWDTESLERSKASLEAAIAKAEAILAECDPYEAEYASRPWTRAWKVTNVGGHIHRTMACQTCFPTTQFGWLPQVSGLPEAEIVELAASAACTICYPSAPVDKPTQLFTKSEQEAQAEREAKAAAKIERERKRLEKAILPDGSDLLVQTDSRWPERIKTLVAARTWLTDAAWWSEARGSHPSYPPQAVAQVAEAVAAKESKSVEQVLAEAEKRAKKRK